MMSDGKSYFDKILETNPEFLNWAKKEAMFFPPDRSESVPKYIERRLVERNWPSEIEKVLVLIRDESNATEYQNGTNSADRSSDSLSPQHNDAHQDNRELSQEDQEFYTIRAKVDNSIKQLPHDPVQNAKTIISCINNAVFEADAVIRVLALEAAKNARVDQETENEYINVWSVDKRAVELLSAWFEDACSTKPSEIKLWSSTHLPLLLFLTKIDFETEKLKKYNFLSLVKQLSASTDPNVAEAAKNLEQKWTQQLAESPTSRPSSKRSSSESGSDAASKKVKVEGKTNTSLFPPSAKSTMSKLPSFKKAPKVQEIPAAQAPPAKTQDSKIPSSSTMSVPSKVPPSTAAAAPNRPASTANKQNPFADSLAMMSQEQQKKRPAPSAQPARPPPAQREQDKRQAEAAAPEKKKKKAVRWVSERDLVSVRFIESREEQDDYQEHFGDARQLEMDEGAMLRKHITTEDEDQPQEFESNNIWSQYRHHPQPHQDPHHRAPPHTPHRRTKDIRKWLEPYMCDQNIDDMSQRGSKSSEKQIQEQREATTIMATYLTEDQIPTTPLETKKALESHNDDSKTKVMIKADVVNASVGQNSLYNSIPGAQFGSSYGLMPTTSSIQPEQHNLINQIMASNPNPNVMQNYTAYDPPQNSKAFYQAGERDGEYNQLRSSRISHDYGRQGHSYSNHSDHGPGSSHNYYQKPKYECKFYKQGNCNKGDRCTFKHSA